ncbi:Uncharacterised protein [Bordetella ansorpii]|uniref:Uncharacterized protein n=1 Tax=Bordetella ansorpii TaxID=288768 RepID=A0A157PMN4_9BORD|nr:hypothetical protein [Bordetella ansorpii]SAI34594.1 Uncharacterised protein [Bordetella ansorpii]
MSDVPGNQGKDDPSMADFAAWGASQDALFHFLAARAGAKNAMYGEAGLSWREAR